MWKLPGLSGLASRKPTIGEIRQTLAKLRHNAGGIFDTCLSYLLQRLILAIVVDRTSQLQKFFNILKQRHPTAFYFPGLAIIFHSVSQCLQLDRITRVPKDSLPIWNVN